MALNAGIHNPDGIILDLEDAVAYDKKHEARFMVRNALRGINFYGAERMVRINQIPAGLEDLQYIIPHHINLILVPKCESAEQIVLLNQHLDKLKKEHGISDEIWLMPIIESALGVMNSFAIAKAADNIVAMAIGLEDYTADLGVKLFLLVQCWSMHAKLPVYRLSILCFPMFPIWKHSKKMYCNRKQSVLMEWAVYTLDKSK